jgi:hypothetical protein
MSVRREDVNLGWPEDARTGDLHRRGPAEIACVERFSGSGESARAIGNTSGKLVCAARHRGVRRSWKHHLRGRLDRAILSPGRVTGSEDDD